MEKHPRVMSYLPTLVAGSFDVLYRRMSSGGHKYAIYIVRGSEPPLTQTVVDI